MASGAYKGLTIRIGADTTSLASALRGANSAIFKTQKELRNLNKAAKLDPGNNKVQEAQLGAMANQAMDAAAKMDTLNKSIESMRTQASKNTEGKTIGDLAEATDNAALSAENAKKRYTELTDDLARVHDGVESITGIDLGDLTRQSAKGFDEGVKKLKEWEQIAREAGPEDLEKFAKKNGGSVDEVIQKVRDLKASWNDANREFSDASMVQSLHNAQTEATVMEATVKGLAKSMAELNSGSKLSKSDNIDAIDQRVTLVGAAADAARERFERLDKAANLNPTSLGTMRERAIALADATGAAREKAVALGEKIASYKSAGIDKIAKDMGNVSVELEKSKSAYVDQEANVARLSGELDRARVNWQALNDAADKGGSWDEDFKKATSECDRLEKELKEAKEARDAALERFDTAKACSELEEAQTEVRELNASIKEMGRIDLGNVSAAAVQAAQQLGQYASQIGQKVIEASTDVDSSYRDLRKTFDAEEADYQKLYDAAMKYSQTHVTSADTMLEMEAIAAQVGIGMEGGADAIQHFAEVASNLDVATDIDAETIALQMGQIVNVMDDLREDNVERFGDALVKLGNTMPAQESSIMQITQRLAAVGSVANFTTPELMGWAAAIAGTGQRSEAAATGISNTITAIQKAVGEGGDALTTFAETAGLSADEFAQKWADSPTEALKLFLEGLNGLDDAALQRLEDLDITGVRQTQTLLALAQTTDTVTDAINKANTAWGDEEKGIASSGDAAAEAEKKAEGFSGTLSKLQNSVQVLAASFGDALVPWMERATDAVQGFGKWVDGMGDGFKRTTVLVGGALVAFSTLQPIVAALGGHFLTLARGGIMAVVQGFTVLPAMVKGTGVLMRSFIANPVAVSAALSNAGGSAGMLGKALSVLATPIGATGGALAALGIMLGAYYGKKMYEAKKYSDGFKEAVEGVQGATEDLGRSMAKGGGIDEYAEKWTAARVEMEKYHESLKEHVNAQNDTRDSMETTIGEFNRWQEVIDDAVGKGDDYTGSMGRLQWAIDALNKATGESWTAEEILTGKFQDENGVIRSTRDELDKLIETRKREAQIQGTQDMLSENYKMQEENALERQKAATAYRNYLDSMWETAQKSGNADNYKNKNEFAKDLMDRSEHFRNLALDVKNLRSESILLDEQEQDLIRTLDTLATDNGWRDNIILSNDAMREAAERVGLTGDSLTQFTNRLQDSKVGVKEFSELSAGEFSKMVDESGGDIDKLVQKISDWNMAKLEDKYGKFNYDEQAFIDAEGNRTEWNENDWEPVTIDVEGLSDARAALMLMNEDMHNAIISNTDWGSSVEEIQPKVQELATKLEEAHVGMGRFTDLAENHPDLFGEMVEQSKGDMDVLVGLIDEWNRQQLNDINLGITWDGDEAFTTAEGVRYEWNNGEWRVAELTADGSQVTEEVAKTKDETEGTEIKQDIAANIDPAEHDAQTLKETLESQTIRMKAELDTSGVQQPEVKDQTVKVGSTADTSAVKSMIEIISKVPKNPKVNLAAKVTGQNQVNTLNTSLTKTAKNWDANLKANVSGTGAVNDLLSTLRSASGKVYTTTYKVVTQKITEKINRNATGGYIPMQQIPRHADGFIATRPTLTQYGWIGEDGAEAYSGGSLVPLTNRKYSRPYVDDISDAVVRKMGPMSPGPQISIVVNGVESAEETADAIARKLALLDL